MNYKITDMRKIKRCPKCKRCKLPKETKCQCGYEWKKSMMKKTQPPPRRSTDYEPLPELTAEEKERAKDSFIREMQNLVKTHPAIFAGKRWDEYRETEQGEAKNESL